VPERRKDRNILAVIAPREDEVNLAKQVEELRKRLEVVERKLEALSSEVAVIKQVFREYEKLHGYKPCPFRILVLAPDKIGNELIFRVRPVCTMTNTPEPCNYKDPTECPKLKRS